MAKLSTQEFIDALKELSVLELNELVKACEEEFGVSAAAGVVVAGPAAGGAAAESSSPRSAQTRLRSSRLSVRQLPLASRRQRSWLTAHRRW